MGSITGFKRNKQTCHATITCAPPSTKYSAAAIRTLWVAAAHAISTAAITFQGGWKRVQPSQQRRVKLDTNLTPLRLRFEGTHQRAPTEIFSRAARFLIL